MPSNSTTYETNFKWPKSETQFKSRKHSLEAFLHINNAINHNLFIHEKPMLPRCEQNHEYFIRSDEKYSDYLRKIKIKPNFECDENYLNEKLKIRSEYQHKISHHRDHNEYKNILCVDNDLSIGSESGLPSIKYSSKSSSKQITNTNYQPSLHLNFLNGLKLGVSTYRGEMCRDVELFLKLENQKLRNSPIDKYTKL